MRHMSHIRSLSSFPLVFQRISHISCRHHRLRLFDSFDYSLHTFTPLDLQQPGFFCPPISFGCIGVCSLTTLVLALIAQAIAFAPRVSHVQRTAPLAAEGTNLPGPPYSGPAVKPILDSIQSPADMKRLDMRQLKQVRTS